MHYLFISVTQLIIATTIDHNKKRLMSNGEFCDASLINLGFETEFFFFGGCQKWLTIKIISPLFIMFSSILPNFLNKITHKNSTHWGSSSDSDGNAKRVKIDVQSYENIDIFFPVQSQTFSNDPFNS